MTAKKKPAEDATATAAAPTAPEPKPSTEPEKRMPIQPGERIQTANFNAYLEEKFGLVKLHLAPNGWVGPPPLSLPWVRAEEFRDLLNQVLGE